jgi:hypothetical protein
LAFASAPSIPFAVSGAPMARDSLATEASLKAGSQQPWKSQVAQSPCRAFGAIGAPYRGPTADRGRRGAWSRVQGNLTNSLWLGAGIWFCATPALPGQIWQENRAIRYGGNR